MGEFGWSWLMVCAWWLRLTASKRRREGAGGDRAEGGTLGETGSYATDKHGGGEVCEWRVGQRRVVLGIASAQSPASVTERARPGRSCGQKSLFLASLGQPRASHQ
jgi:hypothetical protein